MNSCTGPLVVYNTAMNMDVPISDQDTALNYFIINMFRNVIALNYFVINMFRNVIPGAYDSSVFKFLKNCLTVSQNVCTN